MTFTAPVVFYMYNLGLYEYVTYWNWEFCFKFGHDICYFVFVAHAPSMLTNG
jgi:hypothetical protein